MMISLKRRRTPPLRLAIHLILAVPLVVAGLLVTPAVGWAHAAPVGLDPPHGAQLDQSPAALNLQFTQPVEIGFSQVTVRSGSRVVNDPGDLRLNGDRVVVQTLPPLDSGRYDVSWRVLSIDGHITQGSYYFQVMKGPGTVTTSGVVGAEAASRWTGTTIGLYGGGAVVAVSVAALLTGTWHRRRRALAGRDEAC